MIKAWGEAMRLRTLPVSVAGVLFAIGYSLADKSFSPLPAVLCFIFAVLSQISSNFANEYYDFKAGFDKVGRVGPRRGVTEGDITPSAMKCATYLTLGFAGLVGLSLTYWGGIWLISIGIIIAVGVLAYSTGPYPLSHHGLGEIAVIFFFGIIPVNFTYYIMSLDWNIEVFWGSLSMGLMGANVLIVNNYRDIDDDRSVNKHTLAVIMGRKVIAFIYLINGLIALGLTLNQWFVYNSFWLIAPAIYFSAHIALFIALRNRDGSALNPLLGMTAVNMLIYSILFTIAPAINNL